MKISAQIDEKYNGYDSISKPTRKMSFNSQKEAREFLSKEKYPSQWVLETKKHGYLCNGEDFVNQTSFYKSIIRSAK